MSKFRIKKVGHYTKQKGLQVYFEIQIKKLFWWFTYSIKTTTAYPINVSSGNMKDPHRIITVKNSFILFKNEIEATKALDKIKWSEEYCKSKIIFVFTNPWKCEGVYIDIYSYTLCHPNTNSTLGGYDFDNNLDRLRDRCYYKYY